MYFPFSFHAVRRSRLLRGFTLIETLIIIFIIGVLAAIATPSLAGMLEAARVNQATAELRSSLQETQRQSLRSNQACETRLLIPGNASTSTQIMGNCLVSGDRSLPTGIGISTNVLPEIPSSASESISTTANNYRSAKLHKAGLLSDIFCYFFPKQCPASESSSESSSSSPENHPPQTHSEPSEAHSIEVGVEFGAAGAANFEIAYDATAATPTDHSAKFIAYRPKKIAAKKKCVVLSGSLGLTRIGTYSGGLTPPEITHGGTCTALAWTQQ